MNLEHYERLFIDLARERMYKNITYTAAGGVGGTTAGLTQSEFNVKHCFRASAANASEIEVVRSTTMAAAAAAVATMQQI